jgi:hypothetical protein
MTNFKTMEAILRAITNVNTRQATPLEDRAITLMKGGKEGVDEGRTPIGEFQYLIVHCH